SDNRAYDEALVTFVERSLGGSTAGDFLASFRPLQARVARAGMVNSLAQLVLKLASPGVPDFYQGTELWDLNLVDPDNRRPVDYEKRRQLLAGLMDHATPEELLDTRRNGAVKLFVMRRALETRARLRSVFEHGDYVPLETTGTRRDCVFAFARRDGAATAVACVPRLIATLVPDAMSP